MPTSKPAGYWSKACSAMIDRAGEAKPGPVDRPLPVPDGQVALFGDALPALESYVTAPKGRHYVERYVPLFDGRREQKELF